MKKGFTLIELLVAIAIIGALAAILVSALSNFRAFANLTEAHVTILGFLRDARSRTLASKENNVYGVHFETGKAVLFKGAVFNSGDPSNEEYLLPPKVSITSISLTGGASETVFTRLMGTTTASGTITLSNSDSATKVITIFSTGSIE